MSLKLINESLQLLHDIHGAKADQVVLNLRKVRSALLNEVGTVASAVKPVVEAVKEVVDETNETVEALTFIASETPKEAEVKPATEAVDLVDNARGADKEPEPLAKVIAKKATKAKRKPGRPRRVA